MALSQRFVSRVMNFPKHLSSVVRTYVNQHQDFEVQESGLNYKGHRPTTFFQKGLLAAGSAIAAINDPLRSDMVATLGETTGYYALRQLQSQMLNDETGIRILNEKPIVDSEKVKVEELLQLPENTFGYTYAKLMDSNGLSSNTRPLVHYLDDSELAYIMKRYRQIHDFIHTILGFSVTVPAELVVKWFEFAHFGFPMATLASVFGPLPLSLEEKKEVTKFIPWAVYNGLNANQFLNVYFEERFEQDFKSLKEDLGLISPPYDTF